MYSSWNSNLKFHLKTYIDYLSVDYPDRNIIVEGCHFTPKEFLSAFPNSKVIALGITNKMTALKQINKRDWMSKLENDIKMEYVNQIVEYSKELKNEPNIEYIEFSN